MNLRHLLHDAARQWLRSACAIVAACAAVAPAAAANAATAAAAPADATPTPYALPDTERWTLHASRLQRDYELVVALPKGYAQSAQRYPVVFVTDAGYGAPLLTAIERHVAGHSRELAPFIVVGLGYATGETPEYSRRRDYTPTAHGDADAVSDMPGRPVLFGQAEAYRLFVRDEVFPFIAAHYRGHGPQADCRPVVRRAVRGRCAADRTDDVSGLPDRQPVAVVRPSCDAAART